MLRRWIPALVPLMLLPDLARGVDFSFMYTDPVGQGFFDPTAGAQRRAALEYAGQLIGHTIQNSYFGETVVVQVNTYSDPNDNKLASAKPAFYYGNFGSADPRYQTDTHYAKALASHLLGHEIQADHIDIVMNVNLANPFYFGTDGNPGFSQYDFASSALHELMHGLGFDSSFRPQGGYGLFGDGTSDTTTGVSGFPLIFDRFVTISGTQIISEVSSQRATDLVSNSIFWSGGGGFAGNGGVAPRLFAPNPFQVGSSISHTDGSALPSDPMNPALSNGQARQSPSAADRGILSDLGWNIAILPNNVTWTAGGGNNLSSNNGNWSQAPYPGDNFNFSTNPAGVYDIKMDAQLYQFSQMHFTVSAPAYTFRLRSYTDTDLTGAGILNDGLLSHTFILETSADDVANNQKVDQYFGRAATLNFRNNAVASNITVQVEGGATEVVTFPNSPPAYHRDNGAAMNFYNASNAGTAAITVHGASGDGAPQTVGRLDFRQSSSAANATIINLPGVTGPAVDQFNNITSAAGSGGNTNFHDNASAGFARLANTGQDEGPAGTGTAGITNFLDNSDASAAVIDNFGTTYTASTGGFGGRTQFQDNSTADNATITNHESTVFGTAGSGVTTFSGTSSGGTATIENLPDGNNTFGGSAGHTVFAEHSSSAGATINNRGATVGFFPGYTQYRDDATAGSSNIHIFPTQYNHVGALEFFDRASAANATISVEVTNPIGNYPMPAEIIFHDTSSAGVSSIVVHGPGTYGEMYFRDQSSAASSHITVESVNNYLIIFQDSSSAGNAAITGGANCSINIGGNATAANSNLTAQYFNFNGNNTPAVATVFAGTATMHVLSVNGTFSGGFCTFAAWSSADHATIYVAGAASPTDNPAHIAFGALSTIDHATIILESSPVPGRPGGDLTIGDGVTANDAHIIANAGSFVLAANVAPATIGLIQGAGALIKNNVGVLNLASADYTGPTSVTDGTLLFSGSLTHAIAGVSGAGALQIGPAATLTSDGLTLSSTGSLTINGTHTLRSSAGGGAYATHVLANDAAPLSGTSKISALTFGPTGILDLRNNALIVEATAASKASLIQQIALAVNPLANGSAAIQHITSSTAATNPIYAVVVADNADLGLTTFGGLPVDANSILVTQALLGDANLDGVVNPTDLLIWAHNFNSAGSYSVASGDLNNDGVVNPTDLLIWAHNFNNSTAGGIPSSADPGSPGSLSDQPSPVAGTPVPEPASALLLLTLTPLFLKRRRPACSC